MVKAHALFCISFVLCRMNLFGDNWGYVFFGAYNLGCTHFLFWSKVKMNNNNKIGRILFGSGVAIIVIGIIGSFICGAVFPQVDTWYSVYSGYHENKSYNWGLAIGGVIASFISGMLYIALAEIIRLLQDMSVVQSGKQDEETKKFEQNKFDSVSELNVHSLEDQPTFKDLVDGLKYFFKK